MSRGVDSAGAGDGEHAVTFSRSAYDAIVAHTREGAPEEVCGVLGGRRDAESRVRSVHRTANVAEQARTAYRLDPAEQYDAMRAIEDAGDDVVGFYHSHPTGPPGPSATDRARATWDGYSYVIVALGGEPTVGSWRWTGDGFEREDVRIE